jgi:hypothetical protein
MTFSFEMPPCLSAEVKFVLSLSIRNLMKNRMTPIIVLKKSVKGHYTLSFEIFFVFFRFCDGFFFTKRIILKKAQDKKTLQEVQKRRVFFNNKNKTILLEPVPTYNFYLCKRRIFFHNIFHLFVFFFFF